MASLKTRERETRALAQAAEEIGPCPLTIITEDATDHIRVAGRDIRVIPAWQWLRGEA